MKHILLSGLLSVTLSSTAEARTSYVDDKGTRHMVDSEADIPEKFRKPRPGTSPAPSTPSRVDSAEQVKSAQNSPPPETPPASKDNGKSEAMANFRNSEISKWDEKNLQSEVGSILDVPKMVQAKILCADTKGFQCVKETYQKCPAKSAGGIIAWMQAVLPLNAIGEGPNKNIVGIFDSFAWICATVDFSKFHVRNFPADLLSKDPAYAEILMNTEKDALTRAREKALLNLAKVVDRLKEKAPATAEKMGPKLEKLKSMPWKL